ERVRRPQVPVQQRIGSAKYIEHLYAPGELVPEPAQSAKQTITQRGLLRRRLDPGWKEALEYGDGVAHVGLEERGAQVAAVMAAFGKQGVAGRASVELGDEIHNGFHAGAVRRGRLNRPVTQIFIHVPHPPAL